MTVVAVLVVAATATNVPFRFLLTDRAERKQTRKRINRQVKMRQKKRKRAEGK